MDIIFLRVDLVARRN